MSYKILKQIPDMYPEPCQTSTMECFAEIVNDLNTPLDSENQICSSLGKRRPHLQ